MGRTPAVRHPPRRRMRMPRVRIILGAAPRMRRRRRRRRMAVRRMATTRRMTKAAMTSAPPVVKSGTRARKHTQTP
jgi:hypothetical protein